MSNKNKTSISDETVAQAMQIAKATQQPNQSKEQTKQIAKGIEKGIAQYKQQEKIKKRERDKQAKKQKQRKPEVAVTSRETQHNNKDRRHPALAVLLYLLAIFGVISLAMIGLDTFEVIELIEWTW